MLLSYKNGPSLSLPGMPGMPASNASPPPPLLPMSTGVVLPGPASDLKYMPKVEDPDTRRKLLDDIRSANPIYFQRC